MKKGAV